MSNKTFIPALRARVGDWTYYICVMKYAEVAKQVQFAYELGGNKDLSTLIQRGITDRTTQIRDYLLRSEHRFLGALIIAAFGGEPKYIPVAMDDPDGMLKGIDEGFGVLTFDGSQSYFALDGQHRLRAIKDAMLSRPDMGKEDICVIMVSHYDTPQGRERTQRLFTNINRNAKPTTPTENIALDVDDGIAILTRRMLTEHPFLGQNGRIKVFIREPNEAIIKMAHNNVNKGDPRAFTTMGVLYEMLRELAFGLDPSFGDRNLRPSDDALETGYQVLNKRMDDLLLHCGALRSRLESTLNAKDVRSPKGMEGQGHPFMRPVVQKAVSTAVKSLCEQAPSEERDSVWDLLMQRLAALTWRMDAPPWSAVYSQDVEKPESGKILASKDHTELLYALLLIHLKPRSKKHIRDARRDYNRLKSAPYPYPEDTFFALLAEGNTDDEETPSDRKADVLSASAAGDSSS